MLQKEFENTISERIEAIKNIMHTKAVEYASDTDVLANFKQQARFRNCSQETILGNLMLKQISSIYTFIDDYEKGYVRNKAIWNEKINDSIVYLMLLGAIRTEGNHSISTDVEVQ